jgi:hypothetical protein
MHKRHIVPKSLTPIALLYNINTQRTTKKSKDGRSCEAWGDDAFDITFWITVYFEARIEAGAFLLLGDSVICGNLGDGLLDFCIPLRNYRLDLQKHFVNPERPFYTHGLSRIINASKVDNTQA